MPQIMIAYYWSREDWRMLIGSLIYAVPLTHRMAQMQISSQDGEGKDSIYKKKIECLELKFPQME